MASVWAFSSSLISSSSLRISIVTCKKPFIRKNQAMDVPTTATSIRRSGNYPPSLWSYDQVQSLTSKYTGEKHTPRLETLKESVRTLIYKCDEKDEENPLKILNLVDDLQRLGISYHFEKEISDTLKKIYHNYYETPEKWTIMDLNLKALGFRLLRQNGYHIPQDIFEDIKDDTGKIKEGLQKDIIGMLNLYEASYHSLEDELLLDEARDFTKKYLNESVDNVADEHLSALTNHTLDIPLHWMVPRVESKWFIDAYEKRTDMKATILELAKLDFNLLQAIHQEDLKYTSRWWKNTSWDTNLSFVRDRLVENFLWTIGANSLPEFGPLRRVLAQIFSLTTTMDDIYDLYGTLEELEQLTEAVCRWDINSIEGLPEYLKIYFVGLYNTINEMSYCTLKDTWFFNISYLKKTWGDLCKAYLKEAQWYHSGYTPTLEEYIENGYVSITQPVMLTHISFFTSVSSTEEILQSWKRTENILRYSGTILRLADDLGTCTHEMEKGDTPKSVQCYMHETGATEDEARMYVKMIILNTWKKLNKERLDVLNSKFLKEFTDCGSNLARMAQFMYHKGDGHGHHAHVTKSHVDSLLVNPM